MRGLRLSFFLMTGVLLLLRAVPVTADIYRYRDEKGIWHFTNINSDRRYKLYIRSRHEEPAAYIKKYGLIIDQAAERFNVDSSLIRAVIKAESDFDQRATSEKGAQGLMQLMPGTSSDMSVEDPYNPEENIFGGARYLGILLERFKNNLRQALAAYNAGPEKVEAHKGVPPYKETETFINRVMNYYKQYKSAIK